MGEAGPLRCSQCRAYINPFMQFTDYGRKFLCNFCGAVNATPHDYVENVGPDGRRRDADERAELSRGTVEFVAPAAFMVRTWHREISQWAHHGADHWSRCRDVDLASACESSVICNPTGPGPHASDAFLLDRCLAQCHVVWRHSCSLCFHSAHAQ